MDTVSYADHEQGVRVDLAAGTATRRSGERDVLAGAERVVGTRLADTLLGGDGPDALVGGGGHDDLRGRDGPDDLFGSGRLDGGAGADRLRPVGHARAVCRGGDDDGVTTRSASAIVDATCHEVRLNGLTLFLDLVHRDPSRDVIALRPDLVGPNGDTVSMSLTRRGVAGVRSAASAGGSDARCTPSACTCDPIARAAGSRGRPGPPTSA